MHDALLHDILLAHGQCTRQDDMKIERERERRRGRERERETDRQRQRGTHMHTARKKMID